MSTSTKNGTEIEPLAVKVDPDFRDDVAALAKGRPVIDVESIPWKEAIDLHSPCLARFMATGIKMGAEAFYTYAKPIRSCLSIPSRQDLEVLDRFVWIVERADALAKKLGLSEAGPPTAFAADLASRYPRRPGDSKEAGDLGRTFPVDAAGAEVVAFVVQGMAHAFYVQCTEAVAKVLSQIHNDVAVVHGCYGPLLSHQDYVFNAVVKELDQTPAFSNLADATERCIYIKDRFGTTNREAYLIEERWFYRCEETLTRKDLLARKALLE
jgi:hypothetical protein